MRVDGVPVNVASVAFLAPKGANQKIPLAQDGSGIALDLPAKAIDGVANLMHYWNKMMLMSVEP